MFLDSILEVKRREVAERMQVTPLATLERRVETAAPTKDLVAAVRRPGLGVIAEVKRASPSKGPIRPDLDATGLARSYETGGAVAVSVLTDEPHFGARPADFAQVKGAVSVPVLRKDFVVSDYQVWETRAMGADAVLLIVAALGRRALAKLIRLAGELKLTPLVEVHDAEEVAVALDCGVRLLGINNRDLRTFRVDLETTHRLSHLVPAEVAIVAESGIAAPREAALVREWGADAVLVGESLVMSDDPGTLIKALSAGADL